MGTILLFFQHCGLEDGLPQRIGMDMLQDRKGFIWFSTWGGLCKCDSYGFINYNSQPGGSYYMKSSCIGHIYEDAYGNIQIHAYGKGVHRFNPRKEKFEGVYSGKDTSRILPMNSGKVWLTSDAIGCICVQDSTFAVRGFSPENGKLKAKKVYTVLEDREGNAWILANNGLAMLPVGMRYILCLPKKKNAKAQPIRQGAYEV